MKRSMALLMLLGASLAQAAPAPPPQPEAPMPKGPPPRLSTARMDKAGALVLTEFVAQAVTQQVAVEVPTSDGKKVTQIQTRTVIRYVPLERNIKPAGLQGYDASGKKLSAEALAGRLRKRAVVAISNDGKPVDPVYLAALKPGTVVLVFRNGGAGGYGNWGELPPDSGEAPGYASPPPRERKKE